MSLDRINVKKMLKLNGENELDRTLKGAALKVISNFEYGGGKNYSVYIDGISVPVLKTHVVDLSELKGFVEVYKNEENGKQILLLRAVLAIDDLADEPVLNCTFLECSFEEFFQVCSLLNLTW